MDDMNEIFSRATDADLDVEMAAAGELLQKIAEQEGIDLSQLSDEDVAELMVDLLPKTAADEGEHESAREESSEDRKEKKKKEEAKMASQITFADVAVELNKVAASEGIDLDALDRSEYHELFDIVAESMQDPEYMENKVAQDEATAKLAEADALGRYMARAFMDEQEKIAVSAGLKAKVYAEKARRFVMGIPGKARELEGRASTAVGRALRGGEGSEMSQARRRLGVTGSGPLTEAADKMLPNELANQARTSKNIGRAAIGAGAATLAAGGGYAASRMGSDGKKKKAFDEEALEMARGYLLENGIDPDTGDKLASDDDVAERAAEILAEAGWL